VVGAAPILVLAVLALWFSLSLASGARHAEQLLGIYFSHCITLNQPAIQRYVWHLLVGARVAVQSMPYPTWSRLRSGSIINFISFTVLPLAYAAPTIT